MKRTRVSEEQIIAILREAEAGAKVTERCRRHGISDAMFTFYTWRSKYEGLEVSVETVRVNRVRLAAALARSPSCDSMWALTSARAGCTGGSNLRT